MDKTQSNFRHWFPPLMNQDEPRSCSKDVVYEAAITGSIFMESLVDYCSILRWIEGGELWQKEEEELEEPTSGENDLRPNYRVRCGWYDQLAFLLA